LHFAFCVLHFALAYRRASRWKLRSRLPLCCTLCVFRFALVLGPWFRLATEMQNAK
jgi:hypothetical protein